MKLDRTIYNADNLLVMSRMPDECMDLIYLAPPFNSDKQWENPLKETGKKGIKRLIAEKQGRMV